MLSDIEGMGPGWCMGEAPLVARRGFRCGGVTYGCTMRVSEGYTDKPLTKACDFSLPVRSDLTLYVKREATLRFLRTSPFPSSLSALTSPSKPPAMSLFL